MAHHPSHIARVLVRAAQRAETVTYTQLGSELGKTGPSPGRGLGPDLDHCQEWLKKNHLPPLTSLVVLKDAGKPSPDGIFFGKKFGEMTDEDLAAMQQQCFDYHWTEKQLKALGV